MTNAKTELRSAVYSKFYKVHKTNKSMHVKRSHDGPF